ncbi:MAG: PIN domain-containing protein [Rubrivivax sp.]
MNSMNGADFLDTNILVYAVDRDSPAKRGIAQTLVATALSRQTGVISFQVVQETLQALTRRSRVVASAADAEDFLEKVLTPLWKVRPSVAIYARALRIQSGQGFSFYDSLIVASALESGCRRLLTEDLQHGQRIEGLRIENPFLA